MRPTLVRLVDLGHDQDFEVAMSFAQSIIQSLATRSSGNPLAEIEFIRTRDRDTVESAFIAEAGVVHVMAHGETDPDEIGFWSDDGESGVTLTELAESFHEQGYGIGGAVLFADCCGTAQGRFVKAVRDCIAEPITYIGAKRSIDWHESTTFGSAFYGALFRDRGKGLTAAERGLRAAERAIEGYEAIVAGPCPFAAKTLKPSRVARRALA